jgi:hypothetical protein
MSRCVIIKKEIKMRVLFYCVVYLLVFDSNSVQSQTLYIKGKVTDSETQKPLPSVNINNATVSDNWGNYFLQIKPIKKNKISFSLIGYKNITSIVNYTKDTSILNIRLSKKIVELTAVDVSANRTDTVFGNKRFSVADYEFKDDKLILLTFEKNLAHPKIILTDASQKTLSCTELPDEAERLYKDYQGYINVICSAHIYRITIKNNAIHLASLPFDNYKKFIMPCLDTLGKDLYFSNYQKDYPEFTYYAYNTDNLCVSAFKTVCDKEALKGYNMEYYFLKPHERLYARKLADEYGIDKHKIAATMSGLTKSIFYAPLYAPLFIMNDTVLVFDHYSNAILKYDKKQRLLDSIPIDYNHPPKWREWKHEIIVDRETANVYALYQKNGFYYLKHIDAYSGKIISSYKLTSQYAEKIKVKNNYVYYVYRPFESLQEQFVYKERINN